MSCLLPDNTIIATLLEGYPPTGCWDKVHCPYLCSSITSSHIFHSTSVMYAWGCHSTDQYRAPIQTNTCQSKLRFALWVCYRLFVPRFGLGPRSTNAISTISCNECRPITESIIFGMQLRLPLMDFMISYSLTSGTILVLIPQTKQKAFLILGLLCTILKVRENYPKNS